MTGIPSVKYLLSLRAEPECRTRLIGYLVELLDNPIHTLSGGFVRPAVHQTPFADIVGINGELQALNQAVIQFAADRGAHQRCDS
ncbi:hypothetical protein D3C78_1609470 [compost metagenome]